MTKKIIDSEIFTMTRIEDSRPKTSRKSNKVHFYVKADQNKSNYFHRVNGYPYCGRKNAMHFTENWDKVDCTFCKQQKEHYTWIDKINLENRMARINEISYAFINYFIEPQVNESLWEYYNRIKELEIERWALERKEETQVRIETISPNDITVLPIEAENLTFPISFHDVYYNAEYDDDPAIELNKEKYVKLLQETKEKIEWQLKKLGELS